MPIYLAKSWLVIAVFIVWSWGPGLVDRLGSSGYVVAFGFAVALLLSVLAHELAHALSAKAVGMPAQHIALTLWGGHTQFSSEYPTPGRGFLVAVAGPLTNLALGLAAWLVVPALEPGSVAGWLTGAVAWTNVFVGLFNLLPGLPLDGGAMLEATIWKLTGSRATGTKVAAYLGMATAVGIVIWVGLPLLEGRPPLLDRAVIGLLIAMMLFNAARGSLQMARWRLRAQALSPVTFIHPAVGVTENSTIADAQNRVPPGATVVVVGDGVPMGIVDPKALAAAMQAQRWQATMASVAQVLDPGAVLPAECDGPQLLQAIAARPGTPHVVLKDGVVRGIVLPGEVVRALENHA